MKEQVPPTVKQQRGEKLRLLSTKKRRVFHQKFLGQSREVLWESMKPDGTISGYTDNYIRVVLNELYNSDLRNQLLPVRLKELKEQTINRFKARLTNTQDIRVEMIQTLHARRTDKSTKDLLNEVKMILIDECHHLPATTWFNLVQSSPAPYRFGFSGTPLP